MSEQRDRAKDRQQQQGTHAEARAQHDAAGHSGEGAASALARMIQQARTQRRQSGEQASPDIGDDA